MHCWCEDESGDTAAGSGHLTEADEVRGTIGPSACARNDMVAKPRSSVAYFFRWGARERLRTAVFYENIAGFDAAAARSRAQPGARCPHGIARNGVLPGPSTTNYLAVPKAIIRIKNPGFGPESAQNLRILKKMTIRTLPRDPPGEGGPRKRRKQKC